jgi:hypothetical protein
MRWKETMDNHSHYIMSIMYKRQKDEEKWMDEMSGISSNQLFFDL